MQLLATEGSEGDDARGLGLIPGRVERIDAPTLRVPHVGWNEVNQTREHPLFRSIPSGADFYFVHSYVLRCDDPADVIATVPYGGDLVAGIARGNVAGVQFHPEKSQRCGFQLLRNFLESAERSPEPALTFSAPRS
jgi:glutamine amidotransferase